VTIYSRSPWDFPTVNVNHSFIIHINCIMNCPTYKTVLQWL